MGAVIQHRKIGKLKWATSLAGTVFAVVLALAILQAARAAGQEKLSIPDSKPTFVFSQFSKDEPLRMIAYGDMRFTDPVKTTGTNPVVRRWLAEKIGAERPQALLLTGDMPFVGEKAADWEVFQRETASWREAGFPVLPTLGNHEIYHNPELGVANYLRNFPELKGHRFYSAILGPVEVIALDMNMAAGPRSEIQRWFATQLEHVPASVDFLLILHHQPWVADTQSQFIASLPSHDSLLLRNVLEAHLGRLRAKVLVLNGHIHNYERFERHGVEYVVTGGGGAEPYPILYRGSHDLYRGGGFPVYNYVTLDIREHKLHGVMWKVTDPDAKELAVEAKDEFVIQANAMAVGKKK